MPKIEFRRRFKPFAEDEIPGIITGVLPLLAHPGSEKPFPHQVKQKTVLAIGPEGGFTDYETELLTKKGFEPVSIGERILRVEYAVAACIGKLF
jgi:RsmE family RNA methyltransferase